MLLAYGAEVIETDPLEGSDGAIRRALTCLVLVFPDEGERYLSTGL